MLLSEERLSPRLNSTRIAYATNSLGKRTLTKSIQHSNSDANNSNNPSSSSSSASSTGKKTADNLTKNNSSLCSSISSSSSASTSSSLGAPPVVDSTTSTSTRVKTAYRSSSMADPKVSSSSSSSNSSHESTSFPTSCSKPNTTKLTYNYANVNANRLSSYDNDIYNNYACESTVADQKKNYSMRAVDATTGACRRASLAYPSTASMNKNSLGTRHSIKSNVFMRALNYAKKTASSADTSSWKSKLGKYLAQTSSSSNDGKAHHQQVVESSGGPAHEGCEIIIDDEDYIYSSYHLSRKHPINLNQPTAALTKQQQTRPVACTNLLSLSSGMLSLSSSSASSTSTSGQQQAPVQPTQSSPVRRQPEPLTHSKSNLTTANGNGKFRINNGFNSLRKMLKLPATSKHSKERAPLEAKKLQCLSATVSPVHFAQSQPNASANISDEQTQKLVTTGAGREQQQCMSPKASAASLFTMTLNRQTTSGAGKKLANGSKIKKQMSFSNASSTSTFAIRSDLSSSGVTPCQPTLSTCSTAAGTDTAARSSYYSMSSSPNLKANPSHITKNSLVNHSFYHYFYIISKI